MIVEDYGDQGDCKDQARRDTPAQFVPDREDIDLDSNFAIELVFDDLSDATNNDDVYYLSAACGTGKTTAFIDYIKNNRHDRNAMYVAPTKRLIGQVERRLDKSGIPYRTITSRPTLEPVGVRIMEAIERPGRYLTF